MDALATLRAELAALADARIAARSARFFKTGPGEYAEGDRFRGIRVPVLRRLAKRYRGLALRDTRALLRSKFHEDRLLALLVLVDGFRRGDTDQRAAIAALYLHNTARIDNWDLVDTSADPIVGAHVAETGEHALLERLAVSPSLWERRIAIMATFHFIREHGDFRPTLRIARILLHDPHDLIHKAAGWMLREVGKRDLATEETFLQRHYRTMPRTMLRYAIEKFPTPRRLAYLNGDL